MQTTELSTWVAWLERYVLASLAADAKVPEQHCVPILNAIRSDVLADDHAGIPQQRPAGRSSRRL